MHTLKMRTYKEIQSMRLLIKCSEGKKHIIMKKNRYIQVVYFMYISGLKTMSV